MERDPAPLPLPWTHGCYVCGQDNPLGLHLRFELAGEQVVARFAPRPEHGGFQGIVHGGVLMTVLDEVMFWTPSIAAGRMYWSAEVAVRFVAPARVGVELTAVAQLQRMRPKMARTTGSITDAAGRLIASATGKYLPVPAELEQKALADFCEHPSTERARDRFRPASPGRAG